MLTVFLDLDETLIHSVSVGRLGYTAATFPLRKTADGFAFKIGTVPPYKGSKARRIAERIARYRWSYIVGYVVVWRPGLQHFLDRLFNRYNVGIWTAASKLYAVEVVKSIGLWTSERRLDYLLHDEHSRRAGNGQKDLTYLKRAFGIHYHPDQIVIVDDKPEVKAAQPARCLNVTPFMAGGYALSRDEAQLETVLTRLDMISALRRNQNFARKK